MSGKPRCPFCGTAGNVYLYGRSNHLHGSSFMCTNCDPYGRFFTESTPGAEVTAMRSADSEHGEASRLNAELAKEKL